jgi:tetratricopeptide (TPR) repeat protein
MDLPVRYLLGLLLAFGATGLALAADDADWKACRGILSPDTVSACSYLLTDRALSDAQRVDVLRSRANAYSQTSMYDNAIKDYTALLRLNPKDVDGLVARAQVYREKGDATRALADYNVAIGLKPTAGAFLGRGRTYAATGDYNRAIEDFVRAGRSDPESPTAFEALGRVYSALGKHDLAIIEYARAAKTKPAALRPPVPRPAVRPKSREAGDFWAKQGDFQRAIDAYTGWLTGTPDDVDIIYSRGNAYFATGNIDNAIIDYTQVIKSKADHTDAILSRALALTEKHSQPEALADLSTAIGLGLGNNALALFASGVMHALKGAHALAVDEYDLALLASPNELLIRWARGKSQIFLLRSSALEAFQAVSRAEARPASRLDELAKQLALRDHSLLLKALDEEQVQAHVATTLRRFALVIGNSEYLHMRKLPNTKNDVRAVADVLETLRFNVKLLHNLKRDDLVRVTKEFKETLHREKADWAVIYYSGHGAEDSGGTYILPIDVPDAGDLTLREDAINLVTIQERLQVSAALRVIVFDACRDNPAYSAYIRHVEGARGGAIGDSRALGGHRDLIIYAAQPHRWAFEGARGSMSPFAISFVDALKEKNLDMGQFFSRVASGVENATKGILAEPQQPEVRNLHLIGKHYFNPAEIASK